MRPIKFRAWDKEDKKMIQVYGAWFEEQGEYSEIDLTKVANSYSCILMQFTGLHDKNEKEIYEGDIVKTTGDRVLIHEVFYRQEVCAFELRRPNRNYHYELCQPEFYFEVIGNIYMNADLLKGENHATSI